MRQQNQSSPYQVRQQNANSGWIYGYAGSPIHQRDAILSPVAQQKQPERQAEYIYDEAAFEQAFQDAKSAIELQHKDVQLDQDLYRTAEAGAKLKSPGVDNRLDDKHIGSDRSLDEVEEKEDTHNDETDADELARTAGQLLENVKGDQSQKFQESSFLSLMRQLRDKEIRVEGDKLVDVSMPSSTE